MLLPVELMNFWSKNRIRWAVVVVVVQIALLLLIIPAVSRRLGPSYNQNGFIDGYDQLAANLANGNGYRFYPDTARTMMREPGYPVLLAGLLLVFGGSFTAVKITNLIFALGAAFLIIRIAGRFSNNPALLVIAPLLFLFHPGLVIAESRGGVEIVFTFLLLLFMLTALRAIENNRLTDYALAGAALGLTVLVRSTPMLFPAFLFAYLVLFEKKKQSLLLITRNIACLIVVMLAVLSPWIIRNYSLTRRFVPTASVLGVSAHAGQYIDSHLFEGRPWVMLDHEAAMERSQIAQQLGYPFREGYYQVFYNSVDELKFSQFLFHGVVERYKKDPALFAKCIGLNLFNFWFAGKMWPSTILNIVVQLPYLLFAIAGAILCFRNGRMRSAGPLTLFVLYTVAVYVPILAQARYSIPLVPFLSIFATIAWLGWRKSPLFSNESGVAERNTFSAVLAAEAAHK